MSKASRPGWEPERLKQQREAHGLTLEQAGERLRETAERAGIVAPAANFQTLWAHEHGDIYPGPHYRRAYCLLYDKSEPEIGFRHALPNECSATKAGKQAPNMRSSAVASLAMAGPHSDRLLADFRHAVADPTNRNSRRCLVLVAGYAGSGKSEISGVLAGEAQWALIDKDTVTRPLVEDLLRALGLDANDRHTDGYLTNVRPREYECLQESAYENLLHGVSTVATAPYIVELRDTAWIRQATRTCERLGAFLVPVWVRCDIATMREHMEVRGAERDRWKLENWEAYSSSLDGDFDPVGPHLVIDNSRGAAVGYCDRNKSAGRAGVAI